MRSIWFLFLLVLASETSYSDDADEAFARLLAARSIRCEFGSGTQASWDGGKLKLESAEFGAGGKVTFDSIDANAGKGRIIGNVGAGDIFVLVTPAGITFIEQTAFGNVNVTTVFAAYQSAGSRRFIGVSSRHQDLNGPIPSQYHGTCTILE